MRNALVGAVLGALATSFVATVISDTEPRTEIVAEERTVAAPHAGADQSPLANHLDGLLARTEGLEKALEKIRLKQESLENEQRELRQASASARLRVTAYDASAVESPVSEEETLPAEVHEDQLSRMMRFDDLVSQQERDSIWATETEILVTDAFDAAGFGSSALQDTECKESICRIEVQHDHTDASDDFLENSHEVVPWDHRSRMEVVEDESGGVATVLYITREGYGFPEDL